MLTPFNSLKDNFIYTYNNTCHPLKTIIKTFLAQSSVEYGDATQCLSAQSGSDFGKSVTVRCTNALSLEQSDCETGLTIPPCIPCNGLMNHICYFPV
jgi:hypothetical protein